MKLTQETINKINKWINERTASAYVITTKSFDEAKQLNQQLADAGYKGIATAYGGKYWVNLSLTDNPKQ